MLAKTVETLALGLFCMGLVVALVVGVAVLV